MRSSACTRVRLVVAGSVATALGAAAFAAPAQAAPYFVNNQNDAGLGSLRQAILDSNLSVGVRDDIMFTIPGAGPIPHLITLANDLPVIDDPVDLRGYSQPGAVRATAAAPALVKIVINASQATHGLQFETDGSTIGGIVVQQAAASVAGDGVGIRIEGNGNQLRGSYVGLDGLVNNILTHGNLGDGVLVEGDENIIGGTLPEHRNVISANGKLAGTDANGIFIEGNENKVKGNAIGTEPAMTSGQMGNAEAGVRIEGDRNLVGGSAPGSPNVISANETGVLVHSGTDNRIEGNLIGTDATGAIALGNSQGVSIESPGNRLGGDVAGKGNLISGSLSGPGVELHGDGAVLQGNKIGTDVDGVSALPNFTGVKVFGQGSLIGGETELAGNLISGNRFDGIVVDQSDAFDPRPFANRIVQNTIGTAVNGADALPNEDDGISVVSGRDTMIGGTDPAAEGNLIAFNGDAAGGNGDGVNVLAGAGNSIIGNSIFGNADLGIDLGDDGVTANDAGDVDSGANALQNSPEIVGASITTGGDTSVEWSLDARPFTRYRLEFYGGSGCDPSGNGEGETFLGSASVWTDIRGEASGDAEMDTAAAAGDQISATATVDVTSLTPPGQLPGQVQPLPTPFPSADGPAETSELSPCVSVG